MITIIADTHTHTIASDHAFSTIAENIAAAKLRGLDAIVITEHSPSMPGGPSWLFFDSLTLVPRVIDGVTAIKGIEVNIMDYEGALDLKDKYLDRLEWVIASMHSLVIPPSDIAAHTRAWLAVAKNPLVDVIGHSGDQRYAFEYEPVLRAFKEYDKIVEINSHSFNVRPGSDVNCARIAKRCAELEIPVVVSSDAHFAGRIGDFANALKMLEEVGFPEKLILNADRERFYEAVESRKKYRL